EVTAGRTERLVDAREHAAQPVRTIGGEQTEALRVLACAEVLQRAVERLTTQDRRARILDLAETWVEAGRERVRAENPVAEAVDRRDPRAVELASEVGPITVAKRRSNARPQLAGRLARVSDDEDRVGVQTAVADGPDVALDENRRLARAGSGR